MKYLKIIKIIKDIFSPKKCYSCWKEWHFLCLNCLKQQNNFEEICYICKNPSKNFEIHSHCRTGLYFQKVILLTHYKNPVIKKLITHWKFYKKKDIFEDFWKYLSKLLIKYQKDVNKNNTILVPTPVSFLRKLKRWYNQSQILAQSISNRTGLEIIPDLILKSKHTRQQSKISKKHRKKNLENSFVFNKKYTDKFDNFHIIIVDDVISTGNTLNEISKVLYQNGCKNISCLVIASD